MQVLLCGGAEGRLLKDVKPVKYRARGSEVEGIEVDEECSVSRRLRGDSEKSRRRLLLDEAALTNAFASTQAVEVVKRVCSTDLSLAGESACPELSRGRKATARSPSPVCSFHRPWIKRGFPTTSSAEW